MQYSSKKIWFSTEKKINPTFEQQMVQIKTQIHMSRMKMISVFMFITNIVIYK